MRWRFWSKRSVSSGSEGGGTGGSGPLPPSPILLDDSSRDDHEPILGSSTILGFVALAFGIAASITVFHFTSQSGDVAEQVRLVGEIILGAVLTIAAYNILTDVIVNRIPERVRKQVSRLRTPIDALEQVTRNVGKTITDMQKIQVFASEDQALSQARALQNAADAYIQAMWSLFPYERSLQEYFATTLAQNASRRPLIRTQRIVDTDRISVDDICDHITKLWQYLSGGTYELFLSKRGNYEVIVVDHEKAGLFLYPDGGYDCCFIQAGDTRTAKVIIGMFEELKKSECQVPISKGMSNTAENLAAIRKFIQDFHEGK